MLYDFDVNIRQNRETGQIYYTPAGVDYWGNAQLVEASKLTFEHWSVGTGRAFVGCDVFYGCNLPMPNIHDEIVLDGHSFIVLTHDWMRDGFLVHRMDLL